MYPHLKDSIKNFSHIPQFLDVYTIDDGISVPCADLEIVVATNHYQAAIFELQKRASGYVICKIGWGEMEDYIIKIMLAYFYEDYVRIKGHSVFKRAYNYSQRDVNYFESGKVQTKYLNTFPCMKCGIILPEGQITIDHIHPQSGGRNLALLKVFRACGLTLEGPRGQLGLAYEAFASGSYLQLVSYIMATQLWPSLQPGTLYGQGGVRKSRHSLNHVGTLIYSALRWSNDLTRVEQNCMDSFLNLRPLCLSCNSSKGNSSIHII